MATDTTCDPIDRLMNTLRVRVPGVTDAMLQLELFNTIDEFFRRTNAWRWEDDIVLEEGQREYEIDPPENSVMVRVMSMRHGDLPMLPYSTQGDEGGTNINSRGIIPPDELYSDGDARYIPDRVITQSNVLRYAIFFPTYVSLSLPPSAEAAQHPVHVVLALSLSEGCRDCSGFDFPAWMHNAFFRAWLDGVQGSLMSQISKPYSNPIMAEYHARRFRNQMAFHKQESDRGFIYDTPTWRFPTGGFITRR